LYRNLLAAALSILLPNLLMGQAFANGLIFRNSPLLFAYTFMKTSEVEPLDTGEKAPTASGVSPCDDHPVLRG
jgi:hypothetical protein